MSDKIEFFLDPYRVIDSYASCTINKSKSKLDSLELGVVWKHLFGGNLNGAHDSLVNTIAQTDIITHSLCVPFLNRSKSVQKISHIFSITQQNELKKKMEPTHPVHEPWIDFTVDDNFLWKPDHADDYEGHKVDQ